jgi:hypothetical protein
MVDFGTPPTHQLFNFDHSFFFGGALPNYIIFRNVEIIFFRKIISSKSKKYIVKENKEYLGIFHLVNSLGIFPYVEMKIFKIN